MSFCTPSRLEVSESSELLFVELTNREADNADTGSQSHIINIEIHDNHEEATIGAFLICDLCAMVGKLLSSVCRIRTSDYCSIAVTILSIEKSNSIFKLFSHTHYYKYSIDINILI